MLNILLAEIRMIRLPSATRRQESQLTSTALNNFVQTVATPLKNCAGSSVPYLLQATITYADLHLPSHPPALSFPPPRLCDFSDPADHLEEDTFRLWPERRPPREIRRSVISALSRQVLAARLEPAMSLMNGERLMTFPLRVKEEEARRAAPGLVVAF